MAQTELPAEIRATIHEDAILRVSRFFDASTKKTLNELLQNARRAGATRVEVTIDENAVAVTDDGTGIEDPQSILGFGHSNWSTVTTDQEDPAGMGIYSLARKEKVVVQSNTGETAWRVQLEEDHFTGRKPAPLQELDRSTVPRGTSISFNDEKAMPKEVQEAMQEAARYFPLPVTLNGVPMEQEDFLKNASHVEEWNGVRIGIYRGNIGPARWGNTGPTRWENINFHGVTLRQRKIPGTPTLNTNTWKAVVDIKQCPMLELTLPARQSLVQNSFLEELKQECQLATYRAIKAHSKEEPIDLSWKVYSAARDAGIELPPARPILSQWTADTDSEANRNTGQSKNRTEIPDGAFLMEEAQELEIHDQQVVERAIQLNNLDKQALEPEECLRGYPWYDSIPRIKDIEIMVDRGNGPENMEERRKEKENPFKGRAEAITVRLISHPEAGQEAGQEAGESDTAQKIELPTDLAFWEGAGNNYIPNIVPVISRDNQLSVSELTDLIMNAFFQPGDDADDDSYQTQEEYAYQGANKTATSLLVSQRKAVIDLLSKNAVAEIRQHLPAGWSATITVDADRMVTMQVAEPDSQEQKETEE